MNLWKSEGTLKQVAFRKCGVARALTLAALNDLLIDAAVLEVVAWSTEK
jgi:hypothetical protein